MNRLLLLLMVLIPFTGLCYEKHKLKSMPVSRWREVERMKPDSSIVQFTDTLYMEFRLKDSFSYHNRYGFVYNGTYSISEDSIFEFGTARYKLLELTPKIRPSRMVLVNETGISWMVRDFDSVKIIKLDTAEKLAPVTDIDDMIGHWTVYKRDVKEKAMGTIDNSKTIRSVYITGASTDGKLGYIFSGNDPGNDPSWYVKSYGTDQMLVCEGKTNKAVKVIKCQHGEMILEEDDVKYYLKQFK